MSWTVSNLQRPLREDVSLEISGIIAEKESQIFGRRFVGFDGPKKAAPFSISKRALEDMTAMEAAPQLKAGGLDGGCRILADFGGRMFRPLQRRLRDEPNRKSIAAHQPGKASQDGLGISIDRKAAAEWFQKSAEAGNPCSAYALGKLLLGKEQIPQAIHFQSGWPQWDASYILLFPCKKLCFNICDRNV